TYLLTSDFDVLVSLFRRPWDTCREVPVIEDEQTWFYIALILQYQLTDYMIMTFLLQTSFLLLITLASEELETIFFTVLLNFLLLLLQVLFFEFIVSLGAAILTIVAMPHLDIVTNVTILNGVAVLSALLQVVTQCTAKERNRVLAPSITAFILILLGYILFLVLYIMKDPTGIKRGIWVGLAVGGAFLVSFNWWENYFRVIIKNSSSVFLKNLFRDMAKCQNMLHILSSLLRIVVTACVLGAYVPLAKMDWDIVTSIPRRETRIIAIIIGVQLVSSALCHWFAVAACKMHALRRCFILPLYLASLAVMALLIIPVIVYYQDYRISLNGTESINFTGYCNVVVDGRNQSLNGSVFPHLVLDVTHTLLSKVGVNCPSGSAVSWWIGLVLATLHLWYLNIYRIQRTQDLFIRRLYEGAFIEQSLLVILGCQYCFFCKLFKKCYSHLQNLVISRFRTFETAMVYLCATMWHETYDEMLNIIISIFRLDKYRPKKDPKFNDFTFEAHIYFDDAFKHVEGSTSNYQRILSFYVNSIFTNIDEKFFKKQQEIPDQKVINTPYGGRLVVTMPHGNNIVVHFKDKELIRHKKRWSQVMYLYYLLGWKLMTKYFARWQKGDDEKELKADLQREKHNTYLLALDGDTDFQPAAVMLLIDRLRMYPRVGAACGRIHPTGSGPAVWFQKFEYAISHWLQKTAEHVIGCVLCSPGCFSLFRAEALMDDNVIKRYSTKSMEASHYIQYDQGEDRWLCTLLLKQGWRVEYNAASDAYTNAPEDFKELYNQRRRWGPSTMANVVDLLGSTNIISKRNNSMSKPFMFYQLFAITSSILAPATICLLIAGWCFVFQSIIAHTIAALVLAVIPPVIYLGLCFKLKADTQITIAGILSVIYAFLMLVVSMSIIGSIVKDRTILTPSSIFVLSMAMIYTITAIMHPQEIQLVFHGFLYILCIPSAYLLLTIYSMVNMNNVSWGTRESKPAAGASKPKANITQQTAQKGRYQAEMSLLSCHLQYNTSKSSQRSEEEQVIVSQENLIQQSEPQPQNTIVEDIRIQEEEQKELQDKYLQPLSDDKEKQKKIASDLRDLRNKINFAFFIMNALWLVATFTLQLSEASISIKLPKVNLELEYTGEDIQIDPIGFMFILGFAISVLIQFVAMLYHRIYTLIHYVAFLETEPKEQKSEKEQLNVTSHKKVFTTITLLLYY
uniref:chitin synthase n=1 Tax=Dicentrarchus labrax TaxID=13489 RepID=A0A8P4FX83_DICLA